MKPATRFRGGAYGPGLPFLDCRVSTPIRCETGIHRVDSPGAAHGVPCSEAFSSALRFGYLAYSADHSPVSIVPLEECHRRLESRSSTDGSEQWLNRVLRYGASQECIGYVQATVHAGGTG